MLCCCWIVSVFGCLTFCCLGISTVGFCPTTTKSTSFIHYLGHPSRWIKNLSRVSEHLGGGASSQFCLFWLAHFCIRLIRPSPSPRSDYVTVICTWSTRQKPTHHPPPTYICTYVRYLLVAFCQCSYRVVPSSVYGPTINLFSRLGLKARC